MPAVPRTPTGRSPFVGRVRELRALGSALADAGRGAGRVVLIAGEAGIGKTCLIEEALGASGATAHWGRCREGQGAPAYWPWIQALRGLTESLPGDRLSTLLGGDGALLARLLPHARTLLPELRDLAPPRADDPEQLRFALFDAVCGFLGRLTAASPAVLVLDDLHWADSESLLLLRFLAGEIAALPLLVIGTQRDVEARQLPGAPRLLADTARTGLRIVLRGLEPGEVATLVRDALGEVPRDTLRAIERASEGNPFFVREITTLLARDGLSSSAALVLPEEVREVIRRRLEPLAPEVRRLLGVAAVLGREFGLPPVSALSGVAPSAALALLDEAARVALVQEAGSPDRYRFAHALLHDTVYEDLPGAERAALHVRAAALLEERHEADLDGHAAEIAHHLFRAADRRHVERAIGFAVRAGDLARAALGFEDAAGHYERALEAQIATGRPLDERLPLLLRFGEAQIGAADVDGFRATFLEAARIARELDDAASLAQAALGFASLRHYTGADTAKIGLLEEALDALGEEDSVLRASVLGRLASASYYAYPARERDRLSRLAVEVGRRMGDRDALSRILLERYHVLIGPDDVEQRLAASLETARLAAGSGAAALACEAHLQAHADLVMLDDLPRAELELAAAESYATELRFGSARWRLLLTRTMRAMMAGACASAEDLAEQALAAAQTSIANEAGLLWAGQVFNLRRAQGRLDELLAMAEKAVADYPTTPIWRHALLVIRAERGDLSEARTLLDGLAAHDFADVPRDWGFLPSLAGLADACAILEDAHRARLLYELLLPYARLNIAATHTFWGPVARALGVLALVRGDLATAITHLEEALARARRLGAATEEVRTCEALARALRARDGDGDRARAADLVAAARRRGEALGLGGPLARLEQVALHAAAPASGAPHDVAPGARPNAAATPRRARLGRDGALWTLACDAERGSVKHSKGMLYLRALLAASGSGIAAVELERRAEDAPPVRTAASTSSDASTLRRRLLDLRSELDEAEAWSDVGRADAIRERIEDVAEQLAGTATPRDGDAASAERARLNVTRALHAALRRIATACPELGRHLLASIRTGNVCSYEPDPAAPLLWELLDPS